MALLHAYFLHTRPYRETSLLAEVFTAEAGRLSGAWRGGRRQRGGAQLFQPLLLEAGGRGELKSLMRVEPAGPALPLAGTALFSGFYLNELLLRLLPREEAHASLFLGYAEALGRLAEGEAPALLLRRFEARLLEELGYGLDYGHDSERGEAVQATARYDYHPERGFFRAANGPYAGAALLALAQGEFAAPAAAQAAKHINRQALAWLLGERPLKSRELFLSARDMT